MDKWSSNFWIDLAERVGATFLGALLTVLTVTGSTPVDWTDGAVVWAILGVPTAVSLIKGLLANLANPESGASAVPAPPGPEVVDTDETDGPIEDQVAGVEDQDSLDGHVPQI